VFRKSFFDTDVGGGGAVVTPRPASASRGRRPYSDIDNCDPWPSVVEKSPNTKVPALRDAPRPIDASPPPSRPGGGRPRGPERMRSKPMLAQL